MTTSVTIRDETPTGRALNEWVLDLLAERITVRELIRSRVYQEVSEFNARQFGPFRGLVQPEGAMQTGDGYEVAGSRAVDWELQFELVLKAFAASRVLVLVGDRQLDELDDEVEVTHATVVSFLKLTPLVGG